MTLFAELQRRKVFKVGAAYLVVAWLAVQAASIGFPAFDAPPWALRIFILVAFLGFPISLVFAWAFEVTPEGVKHDSGAAGSRLLFGVAVAFVLLAFLWYFKGQPAVRGSEPLTGTTSEASAERSPPARGSDPLTDPRSIAVLPFVNMSEDKDNAYFSDGISEELLNVLVRVKDFNVASRTSSFAFRDRELGAPAIARELKVRYVLEGSVRKQGEQVRITAQLIDANDDRHLWSETYDRKLADIFKIQDEIANAIVSAVRGSMGQPASGEAVVVRADTKDLNAYEAYLKARELFIGRVKLRESIRLFERAVELDPAFARGWEGLAAVQAVAQDWGVNDRDYSSLAVQAAERALQLDASLSMPWAALANVESGRALVDWEKAIGQLDRAIEADPKNATAYHWRGNIYVQMGFFARGLADQDACLKIDPGYQNCVRWKACALLFAGESEQALALFEAGVDRGYAHNRARDFVPSLLKRGNTLAAKLILLEQGAPPELVAILLQALGNPNVVRPDAQALIERYWNADHPVLVQAISKQVALMWLGEFDALGETDELGEVEAVAWIPGHPGWRNSPGFKRLLERKGMVGHWRKNGFPPQCRAVSAQDFTCDQVQP